MGFENLIGYINNYSHTNGGNNIIYVNDALVSRYNKRQKLLEAINESIKNESFDIYLQPIINYNDNSIASAEVLLRLYDKALGNIMPYHIIPNAEINGQIFEIDRIIFEKACSFIKCNEDLLTKSNIKHISINISPLECIHEDFADKYIAILEKYNIDPRFIVF